MTPLKMPWDEIRREYETTRMGWLALATKYGIASKTTLKRRARAEAWERDEKAIAERQRLADAVHDDTAIPVTLDEALAQSPYLPPPVTGCRGQDAQLPFGHGEAASCSVPAQPPPLTDPDAVGQADVLRLVTPGNLADAQAAVQRQQLALAAEVQLTGLLLMRRLQGVLQPPVAPDQADEPKEALMLGNLQRLIRVNPDRETLAGLVTTATKTIEAGTAMARKALAMDLPGGTTKPGADQPVADPAAAAEATSRNRIALLNSMTPEMAEKMREWAEKVQRERREARILAATNVG
jgi:hypothetical protein